MRSLRFFLPLIMILSGCVTTGSKHNVGSESIELTLFDQEKVFQKTANQPALIELYKNQLQTKDDRETRLKLVEAYLAYQDAESALFTLIPLMAGEQSQSQEFYLQGVALFRLGKIPEAERSLIIARQKAPSDAKIINLMGIIRAQDSDFKQSRELFNQARELMFDDMIIKNNLALIDILEEDYKSAAARLLPLYLNGEADEKVTANLAIIMAKMGSVNHLRAFYGEQYSDEEIISLYHALRNLNVASNIRISAKEKSAPPVEIETVIVHPEQQPLGSVGESL